MTDLVLPVSTGTLATISALRAFTDDWLSNRDLSDQTRTAYRRDVNQFLSWCDDRGLPPLAARFTHINSYARHLQDERRFARRSRARVLSSLSSWYAFLVKLGAVPANPAKEADRPRIDRMQTSTIGFTAADAGALVTAARADRRLGGPCALAVIMFTVDIGARVSDVCNVDLDDLSYDTGHRTVLLRMKGGKTSRRAIPPTLGYVLDMYLASRAEAVVTGLRPDELTGPLFVTPAGQRLDPGRVYRLVRRTAKAAGLPGASQLTPHSFRHAWATIASWEEGASLEVRQMALGHADPRTTQAYDRSRQQLDQDPSYLVAAAIAAG